MKACLFLGGILKRTPRTRSYLKRIDLIVAANGGAKNALRLGVYPHHIIGDLDSLPNATKKRLTQSTFHAYASNKAYSDAELALRFVLSRKPDEVIIFAALGGRMDHAVANLTLLPRVPAGIRAKIVEGETNILFVRDHVHLVGKKGDRVSLLPLHIHGARLKTSGLFYPLNNEILRYGGHGLGNVMTASKADVRVTRGGVFIFYTSIV